MDHAQLESLMATVLWAAFGISVLFGAVVQRTQFCTMGAIADVVHMGDWTRARMWAVAVAVAVLGFNAMVGAGWVAAADSIYALPRLRWLSLVLGGLMFGIGMVLASGCASKSLVRIGGGSLKSLVVMLVLSVSAFATLRGLVAVPRVYLLDRVGVTLPAGQDLPSLLGRLLGLSTPTAALWAGTLLALALLLWVVRRPEGRRAPVWLAGLGVGGAIVALWWVSGRLGHVAEHPETLEDTFIATSSHRMEALSLVSPPAHLMDWVLYFSDASHRLTMGMVAVVGVVFGAAAVALATRRFRWQGFAGTEDLANHLVGAVLMGVGGVTALGCTIGQGLSGVSTLSLGSLLATGSIVAGGVLGLRYQAWRLERMA